MQRWMPELETERLIVRPFLLDDLDAVYRILDGELELQALPHEMAERRAERKKWLEWTVSGYTQLAKLHQPPYHDRAIVLKQSGELIGACGYVPCLDVFQQIEYFRTACQPKNHLFTAEVGLYYIISPQFRRRGYAVEAARALVNYAFQELRLQRIIATTTYDNNASIGVMRRLEMEIFRNPESDPPWLQVVGVVENPALPVQQIEEENP